MRRICGFARLSTVLVLSVMAWHCEKTTGQEEQAAGDKDSCKEQIAEMISWVNEVASKGSPENWYRRELELVRLDDKSLKRLGKIPHSTSITLNKNRTEFGLDKYDDPKSHALLKKLKRTIEDREKYLKPGETFSLLMAVDKNVKWADFVGLAHICSEAGFKKVHVIVAGQESKEMKHPPPSPINEHMKELGKLEHGEERTKRRQAMWGKFFFTKADIITVFSASGAVESSLKQKVIASGLEEALTNYNCDVDMDAVKALVWHYLYRPPVSFFSLELASQKDKDAAQIALPASQSWSQAVKTLYKSAREAGSRTILPKIR